MLLKFFTPTKEKGCLGAIDYLLDEKGRDVAPRVLYGDVETTRQLLLNSTFKDPYTAGCLSFAEEESNLTEAEKEREMKSLEENLMVGLEPSQYDICWIEHFDKSRLELNFHIVNTELTTGKRLQPYLHQFDMPRMEAWKSLRNDINGFADPNAPERRRMLSPGVFKQEFQKVKTDVHDLLELAWQLGEINNRDDLINILEEQGGEIKRKGKDYISVKFPDVKKNIRLKGDLYEENLGTCERYTQEIDGRQQEYDNRRERRIEENRAKLDRLNRRCSEARKKKYKKNPEQQREHRESIKQTNEYIKMVNDDINRANSVANNNGRDLQTNVRELRKQVSQMQRLQSSEAKEPKETNLVLQDLEQPITKNNNNKESEHGKNIRASLNNIRANSVRNRAITRELRSNGERLRELAKQVLKSIQQRFRAKQLRITKSEQLRSDRDTTIERPKDERLQELRERKANRKYGSDFEL
jgi:hypothetical protein